MTLQPSGEKICTVKLSSKEFDLRGSGRKSVKKAEKEEIGRQPTKEKEDNKTTNLDVELKFDQKDKVVFEQKLFVQHQDSNMYRRQHNIKEVDRRQPVAQEDKKKCIQDKTVAAQILYLKEIYVFKMFQKV